MNTSKLAIASKVLCSFPDLQTYIERLIQKIESDAKELEFLKRSPNYTAPIKKKMSALSRQIEDNKRFLADAKLAKNMKPNCWVVTHGSNKPGRVISPEIVGKIVSVQVLWDNTTVSVPERPARLKLVEAKKCEYIFHGDRDPKLVRPIDGYECDDADILNRELNKLARSQSEINVATRAGAEHCSDLTKQLAYLRKRIAWVEKQDLDNFESIVRQGLNVFCRVGAALAEIRDRRLYKQLGYSDFRQYLKDRWNMSKSRAYQLITATEVVQNLEESESVHNCGQNELTESVHNCGHKVLPKSESVTREIAKAPKDLQSLAWSKTVETALNGKVTAAHTKKVVSELINKTNQGKLDNNRSRRTPFVPESSIAFGNPPCEAERAAPAALSASQPTNPRRGLLASSDGSATVKPSSRESNSTVKNEDLVKQFEVGQLVLLQLSNMIGASEQLKLANHGYAQITSFTQSGCSLYVSVIESEKSFIVSPQDIKVVNFVDLNVCFSSKEFMALISTYKSKEEIINSMKLGVLGK